MSSDKHDAPANRKLLGVGGAGLAVIGACICLVSVLLAGGLYFLQSQRPGQPQPAVAYVLDTSPRMGFPAEGGSGQTRLRIAQAVLVEAIRPSEPSLTTGLRVFGNGANAEACEDTSLVVPFAQSNQTQIADQLPLLTAGIAADAALGEAIVAAIQDLSKFSGPHWLVVVTGGVDSCNPQAGQLIVQEAQRAGIDLETFVIGYQLTESESLAVKGYVDEIPDGDYLAAPDEPTLRAIIGAIQDYINTPTDILRAAIAAAATPLPTLQPTQVPPTPTQAPSPTPEGYQAQTACDHPYNPLRLGATWTRIGDGGEQTQIVSDVSGDVTQATAIVTYQNASGESGAFHYACDAEGQRYSNTESVLEGVTTTREYLSQIGTLLGPLELFVPGRSNEVTSVVRITQGNFPPYELTAVGRHTISGPDTITVAAGTFEALKVVTVTTTTLPDGRTSDFTVTAWYAFGVGSVRFESFDGAVSELASYSIP